MRIDEILRRQVSFEPVEPEKTEELMMDIKKQKKPEATPAKLLDLARFYLEADYYPAACKYYQQAVARLQERIQEQERDTEAMSALIQTLERHKQGLLERNQGLEATNQVLLERNRTLEEWREIKDRPVREWREWLSGLTELSYNGEIEVEIKFILPLVKYLGYRESDFKLRQAVLIQIGREKKRIETDWVLYDKSDRNQIHAIIEAKAPDQPLDNEVQEQARSYAFALGAPVYAITQGKRLQIFRRGIQSDTCIVDCDVGRLGEVWPEIHQEMGVGLGIHEMV